MLCCSPQLVVAVLFSAYRVLLRQKIPNLFLYRFAMACDTFYFLLLKTIRQKIFIFSFAFTISILFDSTYGEMLKGNSHACALSIYTVFILSALGIGEIPIQLGGQRVT